MTQVSSCPRPPIAEVLLSKFQDLDTYNKQLQGENVELRERLVEALQKDSQKYAKALPDKGVFRSNASLGVFRDDADSADMDMPAFQHDVGFEAFCQRLEAIGVDTTRMCRQQALEELFLNVLQQEVQISKTGFRLLQHYSVVRVYLLANIAGSERCLIEHDRLDLRSGKQKTLMIPLEIRMRIGESWAEAARRGLSKMVGLEAAWQDSYITMDQSSYIHSVEQGYIIEEHPVDLVSVRVHEIHARLSGCIGDTETVTQEELEQIGLPSGRDFVHCEGSTTLHVWCWKSREYERNGRMKAFEKYLAERGVDTSKLGVGNNKTLFSFYEEAKEQKHCSLLEIPADTEGSTTKLLRVVRILKIKLIAEVNRRKRVLMENERYDASGRKRAAGQLIVRKLCEDQDWLETVPSAICDRIGIDSRLQAECFTIDHENMQYVEETVASKGFVGIMSKYKIHTVKVYVKEPEHEHLDRIGLPRGNDFVSKEMSEQGQAHLHMWSWVPSVEEESEQATNFSGTALEETNRELYDVENVLTQAASDSQIIALGLDKPFKTSLQKLRKCAELLADIDNTVSNVDVSGIFKTGGDDLDANKPCSALQSFITSNFVKTSKEDNRRGSIFGSNLTPNGPEFKLETAFSDAPPLIQSIVNRRDEWEVDFFDVFGSGESNSHILDVYGGVMVAPFCVIAFGCTEEAASEFIAEASSLYQDNPYHGPIHAAQVTHLSRWLTKAMRIKDHQSEIEDAAFILGAFCHDIKHFGKNNNFCLISEHPLAVLYNNSSILENFHSSTCLELLESREMLKQLSLNKRQSVRKHIIENILATDMAGHFEAISKFRVRLETQGCDASDEDSRRFLNNLCLKAGDLGHAGLPWNVHLKWSARMAEEFYAQGDEEMRLGMPISALCNSKDVGNLAKSQQGFLNFVVAPLFDVIAECQEHLQSRKDQGQEREMRTTLSKPKRRISHLDASVTFQIEHNCIGLLKQNSRNWEGDVDAVTDIISQIKSKLPSG